LIVPEPLGTRSSPQRGRLSCPLLISHLDRFDWATRDWQTSETALAVREIANGLNRVGAGHSHGRIKG
jgi:hypothetical protein